ncbi:MAG: PBP1A family penicillin-binding protein [Proteobacteria bacterium]|nr:PBP1A family penicillin-binding protein [Pseudomonadota bacterium]
MSLAATIKKISRRITIILFALISVLFLFVFVILHYSSNLPDYNQLSKYKPSTITRIYSGDGDVVAELFKERRIYVKFSDIPQVIIDAFLAAEDKNFFQHSGIDFISLARATIQSGFNLLSGKRSIGGSTLTQQVAKTFLLSNERTITRKIKEAILAYRISYVYPKERILELYLNQMFFGQNSYGIAAAALTYFGKSLDQINLEEAALIAGLVKAPSALNPIANYNKALARRNWVIRQMAEAGMIEHHDIENFTKKPIQLTNKNSFNDRLNYNGYYVDEVKAQLIEIFGEDVVYTRGLNVYTHLNNEIQRAASNALRDGINKYDKKHGWRGVTSRIDDIHDTKLRNEILKSMNDTTSTSEYGVVSEFINCAPTKQKNCTVKVLLADNIECHIPFSSMQWAKQYIDADNVKEFIKNPKDILKIGDIINVKKIQKEFGKSSYQYTLDQIPELNGGIVVMEPYTGYVLAMVGGYDFISSQYNRATQAKRQVGSVFKPFVYIAALENGLALNSLLLDMPLNVLQNGSSQIWNPKNYEGQYMGEITLRTAFEKSRNIPTVRIALEVGMDSILDVANRLGLTKKDEMQKNYSAALGSFETTLVKMTNAYNIIASHGISTEPSLIESVYDQDGNLLYRDYGVSTKKGYYIEHAKTQIIQEDVNYQLISLLKGAVQNGTARRAKTINRTIGGKTGTTNNSFDTWFIGFSPYITVGIYTGFDMPKSMGQKETGATVALPIFNTFMKDLVQDLPDVDFAIPNGIELISICRQDGKINNPKINDPFKNIQLESCDVIKQPFKASDPRDSQRKVGVNKASDELWKFIGIIN